MVSTDANGPPPSPPPRRAMFNQECTPPIIETNTRGLPSHHHITSILHTRVTHDQLHHTISTGKGVGKVAGAMVVLPAMFRLRGLLNNEVRLGTSMKLVESPLENHRSAFGSVLVVRSPKVLNGGRTQVDKRICAMSEVHQVVTKGVFLTPLL